MSRGAVVGAVVAVAVDEECRRPGSASDVGAGDVAFKRSAWRGVSAPGGDDGAAADLARVELPVGVECVVHGEPLDLRVDLSRPIHGGDVVERPVVL